mmetsp:Transcript_59023/g.103756  ORF Transcript_59023/g.103756 Transcript_59023/m.103756 type:complete len:221 (+) Transcript_59023:258-920(+)
MKSRICSTVRIGRCSPKLKLLKDDTFRRNHRLLLRKALLALSALHPPPLCLPLRRILFPFTTPSPIILTHILTITTHHRTAIYRSTCFRFSTLHNINTHIRTLSLYIHPLRRATMPTRAAATPLSSSTVKRLKRLMRLTSSSSSSVLPARKIAPLATSLKPEKNISSPLRLSQWCLRTSSTTTSAMVVTPMCLPSPERWSCPLRTTAVTTPAPPEKAWTA